MIILRVRSVKKIRKNISSFLIATILFSNLFPVLNVAFAEGEEASSPAPTQSVETAVPATADSSGNAGTVSQTPQTQLTPLTAPTPSLIPEQSMDTTTATTATGSIATDIENSTEQNPPNPLYQGGTSAQNATSSEATTTDATSTEPFNGTASTTNEFISGGNSILGTTTASTSNIVATTSTICDKEGCETYDLSTSTLPTGTTTIKTGDAAATANLLNLLNTNSINSTGTIKMLNLVNGADGNLDLRNNPSTPASGTCTLLDCSGVNSVTAKIQSEASIDNTLVLQAQSGSNAVDTIQNGTIETGNTFTGLNLVNFANTNFVDSNYYVLSLNSFNSIKGDIVLPGLSTLFAKLLGTASALGNINSNQLAETQNNLDINTNTGGNMTENSLSSNTNTGNVNSATNVYNNSNSNLIGGNSIQLLLRISGNWLGKLLGLSDGTQFIQDGNIRILQVDSDATSTSGTVTSVDSTSTAKIANNVKMLSDTGNNLIANTLTADTKTGNAYTGANVINVSNTNVIGKNWMLAIINIFGDLNGNIVFGRPDLQIQSQVSSADTQIINGSILNYKLTIKNNGDAPATSVKVNLNYPSNFLDITNSSFDLGNLELNTTKEISFSAVVKNTTAGQTLINTSTVAGAETDNDIADNTDTSSVTTFGAAQNSGGGGGGNGTVTSESTGNVGNNNTNSTTTPTINYVPTNQDNLQITGNNFQVIREIKNQILSGTASSTHEKITLKNLSNNLIHGVTFYDLIYDANGKQIQKENWDVGEVLPNDLIVFEYDVSFLSSALPGDYVMASEIDYAPDGRIIFEHNGKITLQKNIAEKKIAEIIDTATSTILSQANNSGNTFKNQQPPKNPVAKPDSTNSINLQDYLDAFSVARVYADTGDSSASMIDPGLLDSQNLYYTFMLIFSLMVSSMYMLVEKNSLVI